MDYKNILFEETKGIAKITINRPDKYNALNRITLEELSSVLDLIDLTDSISAVIITGMGDNAFVAGADITELAKLDNESGVEFALFGQTVFNKIENLSKPVIAAVNGFALGGGCELSLACHVRFASANAMFGQPEVNLGIIPGYGGTQRLTRIIGKGLALEYILSGDMIDAEEAHRIGLVNKVFPSDELLIEANIFAEKITKKGKLAIKAALRSVNFGENVGLADAINYEAKEFGMLCGGDEFKEGTSAFLEKRKPNF